MAERCKIAMAMSITGLTRRQLQKLSTQGKVPSAAKLGGDWTYDIATLRQWVRSEERESCRI